MMAAKKKLNRIPGGMVPPTEPREKRQIVERNGFGMHRLINGAALPVEGASDVYPSKEDPQGPPFELDCECGIVSSLTDWGNGNEPNEVGPRCPGCGTQYQLDEPFVRKDEPVRQAVAYRDLLSTPVEAMANGTAELVLAEIVTRDGEVIPGEPSAAQQLTDEWLDLAERYENLVDEKSIFMKQWNADKEKLEKRIHEVREELKNLRPGSEPGQPKATTEPPKQPELPFEVKS
jgi:hypothetical protein